MAKEEQLHEHCINYSLQPSKNSWQEIIYNKKVRKKTLLKA